MEKNIPSKIKYAFFCLTLIFLVTGVSFAALELTSRYFVYTKGYHLPIIDPFYFQDLINQDPGIQFEQDLYTFHRDYGWVQTPENTGTFRGYVYPEAEFRNFVQINSYGLRGEEIRKEKPQWRAAVLGDSFVQGLQVEEDQPLTKVIEQKLRGNGLDAEVLNFGMSSTGTVHQYHLFRKRVLPLKPDAVVLAFFPNDFIDNSPDYAHEDNLLPSWELGRDGEIVLHAFGSSPDKKFITYAYSFDDQPWIKMAAVDALEFLDRSFPKAVSFRFLGMFYLEQMGMLLNYQPIFDVYKKEYPAALKRSVIVTTSLIAEMAQECKRRNITFLTVLIPPKELIHEGDWENYIYKRRTILNAQDFDLMHPFSIIRSFLTYHDIDYIDLTKTFRRMAANTDLYYEKDAHFNRNGHHLAGETIVNHLWAKENEADTVFSKN